MADTADNSEDETIPRDEVDDAAVIDVENTIGWYNNADALCILLTVTVNAIHVIEDKEERKRIEDAYIKALRFLSSVKEQFQTIDVSRPPNWVEECTGKMMRHVFRAIGLTHEIPE